MTESQAATVPSEEVEAQIDMGLPGSGELRSWVGLASDPIFSPGRIDDAIDGVFELREHWIERAPGFYTLGMALYQDGTPGGGRLQVDENNARLARRFGPALEDLRTYLADELGGDVGWAAHLPLPGFHIFDSQALQPGVPPAGIHFDAEYAWADFEEPVLDVVSVTVPIKNPSSGAALEYWPIDYAKFQQLMDDERINDLNDVEGAFPRYQASYVPGFPCVQRGLPLHRTAPSGEVSPSDYRITMQGHAAKLGDRWRAYW